MMRVSKIDNYCIIGGDWNAVVGKNAGDFPSHVVGKFGIGEYNSRGDKLRHWALTERFMITNTCLKKRKGHLWTHFNGINHMQIDYILRDSEINWFRMQVPPTT